MIIASTIGAGGKGGIEEEVVPSIIEKSAHVLFKLYPIAENLRANS